MRESEAHDRFNGVIAYLAGLWFTFYWCDKDVAVMSVLLLSWCDTAASTFGRLFGKYTPRIRRGKSLAGSMAAFVVGFMSAGLFWGMVAPYTERKFGTDMKGFAFRGTLRLPAPMRDHTGLSWDEAEMSGMTALVFLSLVTGVTVSMSEAVGVFHLDDNITIPVLCGVGLTFFLWAFGGSSSWHI